MLFKVARKTQKMHILRGILNQNVTFCVQNFFEKLLYKINFFFKIVLFKKAFFFKIMLFENVFLLKIWRVVKFSIQNQTRRIFSNPKSDAL